MKTKLLFLSIFLSAGPVCSGCYTSAGTGTDAIDGGLDQEPTPEVPEPEPDMTPPDFPDVVDVPAEDPVEVEEEPPPPPCMPQLSPVRSIFGDSVESGSDERPEVITLRDGSFYILARIIDESNGDHRLTAVKVTTAGTRGSDPVDLLTAPQISPFHPLLPVQAGMVALSKDEADLASGKIILVSYVPGEAPSSVRVLDSSTGGSLWPTAADSGESLFVAWTEQAWGNNRIEAVILSYAGVEITGCGDLAPDMTGSFERPDAAFNGEHYLVAIVYNRDPLMPSEEDELVLVVVDELGRPQGSDRIALFDPGNNRIAGRPVVQWAGDRWAVLWQEARAGSTAGSWLHLTTKVPPAAARDHGINDVWSDLVTDFSGDQPGELDMVWTGRHLAMLLKYDGGTAGKRIYFKEIDLDLNPADSTLPVNPASSSSFSPSLTYMENARERYYLFAWLAYAASRYTIQIATYGCTDD